MFIDSHFVHNYSYIVCPQDKIFNDSHFGHNHSYIVCSQGKCLMIVTLVIIILT